jgi:hypothetical protein
MVRILTDDKLRKVFGKDWQGQGDHVRDEQAYLVAGG